MTDAPLATPKCRPRAVALCVISRGAEILVFRGYDSVKRETFYRPFGGSIEFGELSRDAVVREMREELGIEIRNQRLLATLENVFTHEGQPLLFVYQAEPADPSFFEQETPTAVEANGNLLQAGWKPLSDFSDGREPLYPTGLLELLNRR